MAKETRLDKLLSQPNFDLKELKKICSSVSNFNNYWRKYNLPEFKKFVVENYLHYLTDADVLKDLRLKKYKSSIEMFFSDYHYINNVDTYLELAEYHQIKMPIKVYNSLLGYKSNREYNINFDKNEYNSFLLKNINHINTYNFNIVKDDLNKEQLLEMTYLKSFGDYLNVLLEKTTFNDYLNRKNVYSSLRLETPIMLSFGLDKCLDELLKSEIKINIEGSIDNKIDLTEEQTKYLMKYCYHRDLSKVFNIYPVEELFAYNLCIAKDPSIYSDKVNEIILNGEWDKLKDGYTFSSFNKINLTAETAKILLDNGKIKFKTYKNFAPKEEIETTIKEKETEIISLYNQIKNFHEERRTKYERNDNVNCNDFNPYKDEKLEWKIFKIIEDFDISLDFIFETFGKEIDSYSKAAIANLLMRGDVFGMPMCYWR